MWGASLRWYAYFNPIFAIALGVLLFSNISLTKRTALLGIMSVILFYLSYAAFCAVPVLLIVHLLREKENLKQSDIITLLVVGLIALAICAPELRVFFENARANADHQTGGFVSALSQIAITLFVGNAVFPLAIAPGLYAAVVVGLGVYFIFIKAKSKVDWIVFAALIVGTVAMTASGIAIKPRNSVFLLPLLFLIIASTIASLPSVWGRAVLVLVAVFQLIGSANVIEHRDTLKGSFDMDYKSALGAIIEWRRQCKGRLVVFNHDAPLAYLLKIQSIDELSPYTLSLDPDVALSPGDCAVFAKTYHGNLRASVIASFYQAMDAPELNQTDVKQLSEDRNARMKSWVGKEPFPRYMIELRKYDALSDVTLPSWH